MKTVDLDKILGNELFSEIHRGCSMSDTTCNAILNAMKEACRQTLELAAENAKICTVKSDNSFLNGNKIDKQSILNAINQIK